LTEGDEEMRYGRRYGCGRCPKIKLPPVVWEKLDLGLENETDEEEKRNGSEDKQKGLRKGAKKR
jgi:hypothetical protein